MIKKFEKPLLVTEATLPDYASYTKAIKEIWETKWLTNQGPVHNKFESELKEFLNIDNITLFCNGHMALDCAVKSLKESRGGGEIITTPFTFVSTTHALYLNGFTPVFCDIKDTDYTIDEEKIESLITDKTVAIVATHVYGFPCNVKRIEEIAEKHGLYVIYDAAHAFGEKIDGTPIGMFGDISMFSFHATKVFNTIEGGMLSYRDGRLKEKLYLLKNFGIVNAEEVACAGLNAKMNEFQAAMGIENLKQVKNDIENRKKATEVYYKLLSNTDGVILSPHRKDVEYNYSYMPILIDKENFGLTRDELYDRLTEYNIFPRKYFYPLVSNISVYESFGGDLPIANRVADSVLCLPMFGALSAQTVSNVCEIIDHIKNNH